MDHNIRQYRNSPFQILKMCKPNFCLPNTTPFPFEIVCVVTKTFKRRLVLVLPRAPNRRLRLDAQIDAQCSRGCKTSGTCSRKLLIELTRFTRRSGRNPEWQLKRRLKSPKTPCRSAEKLRCRKVKTSGASFGKFFEEIPRFRGRYWLSRYCHVSGSKEVYNSFPEIIDIRGGKFIYLLRGC